MADDPTFFRARAAEAQAAADVATLDNVRERSTRAVSAWTVMADRAERARDQRAARAATSEASVDE